MQKLNKLIHKWKMINTNINIKNKIKNLQRVVIYIPLYKKKKKIQASK